MKITEINDSQFRSVDNDESATFKALRSAASEGQELTFVINGISAQQHIESLCAEGVSEVSIKLLFDLLLCKGKISLLAEKKLIAIISGPSTGYECAVKVRGLAQQRVLEALGDHALLASKKEAALLLMASATLGDSDLVIPPLIRSRIEEFNNEKCKPQWWISFPPTGGVFEQARLHSINNIYDGSRHRAEIHKAAADGACFF